MALTTRTVDMQEVSDLSAEILRLFAEHNPPMSIATLATTMTLVRLFAGHQEDDMDIETEIKHIQHIIEYADAIINPSEVVH